MHRCYDLLISIVRRLLPHTVVRLGRITLYHHLLLPYLGDPGHDLEADVVKSSTPASTTWAKAQYYIPSLYWIPNYTLSLYEILNRFNLCVYMSLLWYANRFGGDFTAGLTVAAMLIPQSVSYATSLAKMSPVTGLVSW